MTSDRSQGFGVERREIASGHWERSRFFSLVALSRTSSGTGHWNGRRRSELPFMRAVLQTPVNLQDFRKEDGLPKRVADFYCRTTYVRHVPGSKVNSIQMQDNCCTNVRVLCRNPTWLHWLEGSGRNRNMILFKGFGGLALIMMCSEGHEQDHYFARNSDPEPMFYDNCASFSEQHTRPQVPCSKSMISSL